MIEQRLVQVAWESRREFEEGTIERELLKRLYAAYADVGDLDLFLNRASAISPTGNCGLATVYLQHRYIQKGLGGGEIVNGRYGEENHTFLYLGGLAVCITADQFDGGPSVYVGELSLPWARKALPVGAAR